MTDSPRFVVAQLGARMHYAVPRILERAGLLELVYTDICADRGVLAQIVRLVPDPFKRAGMKRLEGRRIPGVPLDKISSFPAFGLEYFRRRTRATRPSESTSVYLWAGRDFNRRVVAAGFNEASAVYTFNSASLEILREAKRRGLFAVMEQTIVPKAVEERILQIERERWPGWETPTVDGFASEYACREAEEWALADLIMCGSHFVKQGIAQSGGPGERCCVVPYGVSLPTLPEPRAASRELPLRVLFVGTVGLRKGIPYLAQAAELLGRDQFVFRVVGPIALLPRGVNALRQVVDLVGPAPRAAMDQEYLRADVFVLPSLCEGSATTCYEALAHGLPVVTTPNSGSIIRDGVEGFIIPPGDVPALAEALARLGRDPDLRRQMGAAARKRAATFGDLSHYGQRLIDAVQLGGQ